MRAVRRFPPLLPLLFLLVVFLLVVLLLVVAACRTTAAPNAPGRVVLLSLDGADSLTLHRLFREGKLEAGGFARFFRDGQVAEGMRPFNPAMTAVNHIAMVTGYPPDQTGIVANDFIPPGAALDRLVSGFSFSIETETLWEAARRQGLRVAISAWPGADNRLDPQRGDRGERRRGDWGITYSSAPLQAARILDLPHSAWSPGLPRKTGEWSRVPCRDGERPGCYVKALEIAPDSARGRFYFADEYAIHGYPEAFEAVLRDQLVWPGPPDSVRLVKTWKGEADGIDLDTWVEQDERFSIFWIDALLAMARFGEWDLLLGYSGVLDDAGHRLLMADPRQPGYSPSRRTELDQARTRVWQAVDRDLARLLDAVDLRTTTVLVVSDHGMAPTHTVLDPSLLFREWGVSDRTAVSGQGGHGFVYVRAAQGGQARLLDDLRSRLLAWRVDGEAPISRVLTRAEAAEIGLDHPNSGDLILLARAGYHFRSPDDPPGTAPASPSWGDYGKHGYPRSDPAMQAVHLAVGRGVTPKHRGTLVNTEVADEVSAWLGIDPPRRRPAEP